MKIIDKIKKLHAKAESAAEIGNADEAAAFAAKVQELLDTNRLEMAVLSTTEEVEAVEDIYLDGDELGFRKGKRYVQWFSTLVSGIAKVNGCVSLGCQGSTNQRIIGAGSDRAIVQYLVTLLVRESNRLLENAKAEYEAALIMGLVTRRWRKVDTNSWRLGFASGIRERLRQQRAAFLDHNPNALVVLARNEAECKAIRAGIDTVSASGNATLTGAYHSGRNAAADANINNGIGGASTARRSLTG